MKPSQVCEELGIQDSTLRKYCLALERAGYTFDKTEKGHRIFTTETVMTIQKVMDTMGKNVITLEKAINEVLEIKESPSTSQLITHYTQYIERMKAAHESDLRAKDRDLRAKDREIAALHEMIIFQQVHNEVAASVEKPSLLQRVFRFLVPS